MPTNKWTNARLARLYQRYNTKYWSGKLVEYVVVDEKLTDCIGRCWWREKRVSIDIAQHPTDAAVRHTLLHEMVHVAEGKPRTLHGHGYAFWAQIERLLRRGASFKVGWPEMPNQKFAQGSIPSKLRLCRKALRHLVARQRVEGEKILRRIEQAKAKGTPAPEAEEIDERSIISNFEDAAYIEDVTWKRALFSIGSDLGLIDVDGKPVNAWAAKVLRKAKAAHGRARTRKRQDEAGGRSMEVALAEEDIQTVRSPVCESPEPTKT